MSLEEAQRRIAECKATNGTELDLSDLDLEEIPEEVGELGQLLVLYLSDNQISEIKGLEQLAELTRLDLTRNQISEIKGLEKLANLTLLYLFGNQISEIKGLEQLSNLTDLNLHSNQISEIKGLEHLSSLTNLSLSWNEISEIKGLEQLANLTEINLSKNQISEIKGLEKLSELISLNLYENKISEIKGLEKLSNLTILFLYGNQISEIKGLEKLSNLTKINLSHNQISEIKGLEQLSDLTLLYLYGNQISEIKGLEQLSELTQLILSENRISEIKGLEQLSELTHLDLLHNQISEIKGLEQLAELTQLILSENRISEIKGLERLSSLTHLSLSRNQISEIKGIEQLSNLTMIDIGFNQISEIKGLEQLANLTQLYLYGNQISEIKGLEKLANLTDLNLHSNQISEIKGLEKLANLTQLDLSANQILEIKGLEKCKQLEEVRIHNNPLERHYGIHLSDDWEENHWPIIQNLLLREADIESGKRKVNLPAKILLLGNHAAGKSSLLHYLQTNELPKRSDSTRILKIEAYPKQLAGKFPKAMFYDFGGQDFYHGIYRVFIGSRAGIVLLFDGQREVNAIEEDSKGILTQHFRLSYWMGQKKFMGQKMARNSDEETNPLILVQSHADETSPAYATIASFPSFQHFSHVGLQEGPNNPPQNTATLHLLQAHVEAMIQERQLEKWAPEWYVQFLEYIYEQHIDLSAFKAVELGKLLDQYTPPGIEVEKRKEWLKVDLEQFREQGLLLYYPAITEEKVWLNPQAFVQHVHKEILSENKMKRFKGQVAKEKFSTYDQDVVKILQAQKVVFLHETGPEPEYIIPNFLPLAEEDKAIHTLLTFGLENPSFELKFEEFLPLGLINQLICHFGKEEDEKKFWRNQLVFTLDRTHKVLIRLDLTTQSILVHLAPADKAHPTALAYLFYCILSFYWDRFVVDYSIFKQWQNRGHKQSEEKDSSDLQNQLRYITELYDQSHLRPADLYLSLDSTYFVSYTKLFHFKEDQKRISARKMGEGSELSTNTKEIPLAPFSSFTQQPYESMKKVFISYSKDDLRLVHRFKDALVPLHDDGVIDDPWYCSMLEAGSEWDTEIQKKLQEADIVFFMCSMSFIRTKYIREHEIQKAKDLGKLIIPVILNFCEWENYLGEKNALPYTAKPVADFNNPDLAWLLVTKGVRWALEKDPTKKTDLGKQVKQLYERLVEGKLDNNSN